MSVSTLVVPSVLTRTHHWSCFRRGGVLVLLHSCSQFLSSAGPLVEVMGARDCRRTGERGSSAFSVSCITFSSITSPARDLTSSVYVLGLVSSILVSAWLILNFASPVDILSLASSVHDLILTSSRTCRGRKHPCLRPEQSPSKVWKWEVQQLGGHLGVARPYSCLSPPVQDSLTAMAMILLPETCPAEDSCWKTIVAGMSLTR